VAYSGAAEAGGGRVLLTRARTGTSQADAGASSVEYGLIVFAIAAGIVIALFALGPPVHGLYDGTCRAMKGGADGPAGRTCP
jgi:Flp pilus assembly pilin Flp